jgi:hypothetical protein
MSYGTLHWLPYSQLCGFCSVDYDFIGNLETFAADAEKLRKKFPGKLDQVLKVLGSRKNSRRSRDRCYDFSKYFRQNNRRKFWRV